MGLIPFVENGFRPAAEREEEPPRQPGGGRHLRCRVQDHHRSFGEGEAGHPEPGLQPPHPLGRDEAVYQHGELLHTPHHRARPELPVARQRRQLHPLRAHRRVQPGVQGQHQAFVPQVRQEDRIRQVRRLADRPGAAAGGATNTLVYPLIYVRTVLGADLGKVKKYNSMFDCLVKTAKNNGVLSLYNGIGPSSVGIVVYRGAQFGLQDIIKAFNPLQKETTPLALFSKFGVAHIAVSVSGVVAYPFDTMQRRLQIEASKPVEEQVYKGTSDCFAKILKTEGPAGFFKGALANILRGTGAAIVLVMYDEIMNFLE